MTTPPTNGIAALKRKRDTALNFAQTHNSHAVSPDTLLNVVSQAQKYLQQKREEKTLDEIEGYLSIQHSDPALLRNFRTIMMQGNSKILYNKAGAGGKGTLKYLPDIPVTNADELRAYLQKRTNSIGVKYATIEDGWPKAYSIEALHRMSDAHEALLSKDKKGEIRAVWQDDPTLQHEMTNDLKMQWGSIPLPSNADDIRDKLIAANLKPTSTPRQIVKGPVEKKKKAARKTGKTTNTHIAHLLKDYSKKRA